MKQKLKALCHNRYLLALLISFIIASASSYYISWILYCEAWVQRTQGFCGGLLLFPAVLILFIIFKKKIILAISTYWILVIFLLIALHSSSNQKYNILIATNHVIKEDRNVALNPRELAKYRELGQIQKDFLLSCQTFSNVAASSLLAFLAAIIYLSVKIRIAIPVLIASPIAIFSALWFLPWSIEGRWSGGMLGCMTSSYHYYEFNNNKVTGYDICASTANEGTISDFGTVTETPSGYIWTIPISKNEKPIQDEINCTFLRMSCKSGNEYYHLFAFRNLDYYTQFRFKEYLKEKILKKK